MLPQTKDQLDAIRQECHKLLHKRAALSAAAAVVPLPGCDIACDIALMAEMITTINHKFGLTPEQILTMDKERRKILLVLITSAGNEFIGKVITARVIRNVLKHSSKRLTFGRTSRLLPIGGLALSASISYGAMYYLGLSHIEQCYQVADGYLNNVDTRWLGDVIEIYP